MAREQNIIYNPIKMKGILLLAIAALAHSFAPAPSPRRATTVGASPLDNLVGFIKGGKVGLVKSIAGDYDSDAIRLRVRSCLSGRGMWRCLSTGLNRNDLPIEQQHTTDRPGYREEQGAHVLVHHVTLLVRDLPFVIPR